MTGIFAYIYQKVKPNVGKYSISGAHGYIKHIYICIYTYIYIYIFVCMFIFALPFVHLVPEADNKSIEISQGL